MISLRHHLAVLLTAVVVITNAACTLIPSTTSAQINTTTAVSLAPITTVDMSPLYNKAWIPGAQYIAEVNKQSITVTNLLTQTSIALTAPNAKNAAFSKSGNLLAFSSYTDPISIYDLEQTSRTPVHGPYNEITAMHFSEKDDMLIVMDTAKIVYIWDLTTYDLVSVYDFSSWPDINRQIETLSFSPDNSTIAVISTDDIPAIKLCSLTELGSCSTTTWPASARPFYEAEFSPNWDKVALISGASAQIINLVTNTPGPLLTHEDAISNWEFSPDGKIFAVYTAGTINQHYASILKLWDVTSGSLIQTFMRSTYNYATALNPTWTQLATSSDTGYIHIWNIETGVQDSIYTNNNMGVEYQMLQYSPDGTILASLDTTGTLALWDTKTHKQLKTVSLPNSYPTNLDFSSQGDWITTITDDDYITLWKPLGSTN